MANILAVDDNLELCKLIRTTLERDGHRVETRQAGRDLTEALCRWADRKAILPGHHHVQQDAVCPAA